MYLYIILCIYARSRIKISMLLQKVSSLSLRLLFRLSRAALNTQRQLVRLPFYYEYALCYVCRRRSGVNCAFSLFSSLSLFHCALEESPENHRPKKARTGPSVAPQVCALFCALRELVRWCLDVCVLLNFCVIRTGCRACMCDDCVLLCFRDLRSFAFFKSSFFFPLHGNTALFLRYVS